MTLFRGWSLAICVASGPSLSDEQCSIVAEYARRNPRCSIITVNNTWRRVPTADALYGADGAWWNQYADDVRGAGFLGECWTSKPVNQFHLARKSREHAAALARFPWLRQIRIDRNACRLPDYDDAVYHGGNSGFQAIGLAYLFGARRFVLVGYDMKRGPNGETHWHGDHPKPLTNGTPHSWIERFDRLALDARVRGVEIINCSIDTALTCFERRPLQDALQ